MDEERVLLEIEALEKLTPSVRYNLRQRFVVLELWRFPQGWKPSTGAIVFKLPRTYPREQPTAYIPDHMRYNGKKPIIMLRSTEPGLAKHCIHNLRRKWVPEHHSMITMVRMMKESFKHPNSQDPWKTAGRDKTRYNRF